MKSKAWLALLAVVALGAHASEEESTPCDNVETEQQEYACAAYNRQEAERGLKDAFDELVQRVHDQYADDEAKAKSLIDKLHAAQELWTKLRDADCRVETFAEKPGNKAFEAAGNACFAQRSDERSEYLQSIGQR
ncbi:lysozyme inhibitor LprI family protein [Pseudomonas sp. LS_2]|uniref:lysozyme inhibitor LprI family protein n=1 Tax=Pseudomonas sp. LS_2 TaxID=3055789 RepID=UPI003667598A